MATYKQHALYDCEVTEQAFMESKQGTPGFCLVFTPVAEIEIDQGTGGEISYVCDSFDRKLEFWLSEKAIDYSIEKLRKLGFDGDSFRDLDPESEGGFSFVGRTIRLQCKHEPGTDGNIYDRFDLPFSGGGKSVQNDSMIAAKLDNLFGKKLRTAAHAAPPAAVKSAPVQRAESILEEEDVPF